MTTDTSNEIIMENRRHMNWVMVLLTAIGGTLASALLIWIAGTQVSIQIGQGVIVTKFEAQAEAMSEYMSSMRAEQLQQSILIGKIWPRLRAHDESLALIVREVQEVCKCKIDLPEPDQF